VNLLPGPVKLHPDVQDAFRCLPVSHRGKPFMADVQDVRRRLCRLVNARYVDILLGSGTLSNDAVAAQLKQSGEKGMVLRNGEFGGRLCQHAERWGVPFREFDSGWGTLLPYDEIDAALAADPEIRWLWAVHCETSTGVLNDLERLKRIARERGVKLVMDCISSIGTVPVDLNGVYLTTGVSGKALASYAGLCLIFRHHQVEPNPNVPRYLDLGTYDSADGVAYTQSSNLMYALSAAIGRFETVDDAGLSEVNGHDRFANIRELAQWLRTEVRAMGFTIVAPDHAASPAVITIGLPERLDSVRMGDELAENGFLLSYNSSYLVRRNLIQICLMGELERAEIAPVLDIVSSFAV
jgi:aspartate aminotransferase-like enzyme